MNDYGYDVNLFPFDQLSRITETLSDNSSYYDFAFSTTMRIKQPLEVVIIGTDFENTAAQQARATVNGTPSRSTVGSERIVNTIGRSFIQTKIG